MQHDGIYGVQSFVTDRSGRLLPGRCIECRDADEARAAAAAQVQTGRAAGASAFLRFGFGEFDEGDLITFDTFGDVPDNVRDMLPF